METILRSASTAIPPETLRCYPATAETAALLARYFDTDTDRLVLTPGSDAALRLVCEHHRRRAGDGATVLLQDPNYPAWHQTAGLLNLRLRRITADLDNPTTQHDALVRAARRTKNALIAVSVPNGPLGSVLPPDTLSELAQVAERRGHLLVLDTCYQAFHGPIGDPVTRARGRTLVVQSLSKSHALAGTRIAAMFGDPELLRDLAAGPLEHAVSGASLTAADVVIRHHDAFQAIWDEVRDTRVRTAHSLRDLGYVPLPSAGNFLTLRLPDRVSAGACVAGLADLGYAIADLSETTGLAGCVRFTVADAETTDGVLAALRTVSRHNSLVKPAGCRSSTVGRPRPGHPITPTDDERTMRPPRANGNRPIPPATDATSTLEGNLVDRTRPVNILLIGGCGHWAAKENHVPALLDLKAEGFPVRVGAVCDPRDPYREGIGELGMAPLVDLVREDAPIWLDPARLPPDALYQALDALHARDPFDALVIACNPVHHMVYLRWAVTRGLHALCDKPVVCTENASWDPTAAHRIQHDFDDLLRELEKQQQVRPCHVVVPLRRRANDAYLTVAREIEEVQHVHQQGLTSLNLVKNAGMYRLPTEYGMGDAHGYGSGVGSLAFSSYHFIDVIAWYLSLAPGRATRLVLTNPYVRRLGNYLRTTESQLLGRILGVAGEPPVLAPEALRAEVDFVFHAELLDESRNTLGLVTYSCFNNTYSHRTTGASEVDSAGLVPFREKGRMSQFVMDINQGNLQHLVMTKNDVVGESYRIAVRRRRNPRVTEEPSREWLFEDAHHGSRITPRHLTQAFVRLAAGQELPPDVARHLSFLHDQRLSHAIFAGFYRLMAADYAGQPLEQLLVDLT
ncbi:aminotransferase class I/II-fold pyridoxal phosphate-dependent enzyme [Streptomyces sp. SID3343]|nr:aminotransferase class I/II-fold pyridoxal phosphate-dependent enzyme [Streptomyces sp. SID3343]